MLKSERTRAPLLILMASVIIILPIFLNHTAIFGVDSYFQYNRIYETAMQIKNHNYSLLNLYSFQQAGRMVNAFYSPLLTYLFGALALLVGNWFRFQVLSIIIVGFCAGYSTYYAAKRLGLSFPLAVTTGIIYLSSFSIYAFIFGSNWRAVALAFVPLFVGPMVDLYRGDWSLKSMLILGIVVGLVNQAQFFTTLLVLPSLIPFFIIGLIKSKNKLRSLGNLLVAILLAIVLSLGVILPYLEVLKTNTLLPPTKLPLINGVTNLTVPLMDPKQPLSISILCLILYLSIAGLVYAWKRTSGFTKWLLIIALIYVFAGSNLVPWQVIDKAVPALESYLQLPRRFTIVGISWMVLGWASLFNDLSVRPNGTDQRSKLNFFTGALAVASVLSLTTVVSESVTLYNNSSVSLARGLQTTDINAHGYQYQGHKVEKITDIQPAFHTKNLSTLFKIVDRTTPDYLPVKRTDLHISFYETYNRLVINKRQFKHQVLPHGVVKITWKSTKNKLTDIPATAYGHSKVIFNGQTLKQSKIKRSQIGTLKLKSVKGHNVLKLSYQPRKSTIAGIWLSIVTWVLSLVSLCYFALRKHTSQNN